MSSFSKYTAYSHLLPRCTHCCFLLQPHHPLPPPDSRIPAESRGSETDTNKNELLAVSACSQSVPSCRVPDGLVMAVEVVESAWWQEGQWERAGRTGLVEGRTGLATGAPGFLGLPRRGVRQPRRGVSAPSWGPPGTHPDCHNQSLSEQIMCLIYYTCPLDPASEFILI